MKEWVLASVAILAMAMAGCISHAKPAAATPAVPVGAGSVAVAAPAAESLSTPQTQVVLPPEQPFNPDSLVVEKATPAPPAPAPPAPAPAAHRSIVAAAPPKPDTPPETVEAPPARPPVEEVVPDAQRDELRGRANTTRKTVREWLDSHSTQHLNAQGKRTRANIESLLQRSEEAERRGDLQAAAQLADRAELLMKELPGGR